MPEARPADLFTYATTNLRVIYGDTIAATMQVPHGEMDKKLRLRGIDCPEVATAAGAAAKRHVQALVGAAVEVVIAASKVDKYDRYLADVHPRLDATDRARLTAHAPDDAGWLHLNNALLADLYAERADSSTVANFVPWSRRRLANESCDRVIGSSPSELRLDNVAYRPPRWGSWIQERSLTFGI